MRHLFGVVFSLLALYSYAQNGYADSLKRERVRNERLFLSEVLNEEERKLHPQLCYFEPDTNYRVLATFKKEKGPVFLMPLSGNRSAPYRKYGTLTFLIHDTLCVLNVYQNMQLKGEKDFKNYYFIPFKDGTSSHSTYGAGRYMDCYLFKRQTTVWLDFNTAYHPYCAYSYRYSCPIVPVENFLDVSIPAGECYYETDEE